ncbi:MAG: hypothetical protein ABFD81_04365 [Syntrophaceae bacterium]
MHSAKTLYLGMIMVLAVLGCGRKLPPLPPGPEDPAEITSLTFEQGAVLATITCHTTAAKLVLLGKPQGLCPQCTDDLTVREEKRDVSGKVTLTDPMPQERCMVYRIKLEKENTSFLSPARMVCK